MKDDTVIHPEAAELAAILERSWGEFRHPPGTLVNEDGGDGGDGGEAGDDGGDDGGEQPAALTRDDIGQEFDSRFDQLRSELLPLVGGEGDDGGEYGEGDGEALDYQQLAQDFLEDAERNGGEITPEALQEFVASQSQAAVQQALESALPQAIQQAIQPLNDRFLQQDADALEERYPALADPDTQSEVVQEAVAYAANVLGDPELARNPQVIEQVYLAKMAREGKTAAVPAGGEDAELESGGAQVGGGGDETPIQTQIVQSGGRGGGGLFEGAF